MAKASLASKCGGTNSLREAEEEAEDKVSVLFSVNNRG
jgi:hypothetical protein